MALCSTATYLPLEIQEHILSFTPIRLQGYLAFVCRDWCALLRALRERRRRDVWMLGGEFFVLSVPRAQSALALVPSLQNSFRDIACKHAAKAGRLDVLQYLYEKGCHWGTTTCAAAAKGGHLSVLEWAREKGCPWDESTCAYAALGGHLAVLQWARENGCPWNTGTCNLAANGGHLEVLEWLHEKGAPRSNDVFSHAAKGGHINVFQWLHANGYSWEEWTCAAAARGGHLHALQWLRAHGMPLGLARYRIPGERREPADAAVAG